MLSTCGGASLDDSLRPLQHCATVYAGHSGTSLVNVWTSKYYVFS